MRKQANIGAEQSSASAGEPARVGFPFIVVEVQIRGFNATGIQEAADEWNDGEVLPILLDEMMREDVGVTFVTLPGEKCLNDDFEVQAMNGRIVGARVVTEPSRDV